MRLTPAQIAQALLETQEAQRLVALFRSGRKCDAVPVKSAMMKMFPDTPHEDLAAGLQLAATVLGLDEAEADAQRGSDGGA